MGVTPLLTNSQNRLYGAYSSINTIMIPLRIKRKFAKTQDPTVDYIEHIPDIKVDIDLLKQEFSPYNDKLFDHIENNVLVQKKFGLMKKGVFDDIISFMPYTQQIVDMVANYLFFNAVYYRYVMPNACYQWHQDVGKLCLHIPLISNEGCKFVYNDRVFSMPSDGSLYLVNNSKFHTFVNAGKNPRLHMTFEIL